MKDKIYFNQGNPVVLKEINKISKKIESLKILDIGCGAGNNSKILVSKGHNVDGITLSATEAEIASNYLREIYIFNIEDGLPDKINNNYYDIVLCSHVLEHLSSTDLILSDIHRVLNKNGHLLVCLPNIMHYKSRWDLICGNFNYTPSGVFDDTHLRWYTYQSGENLLVKNGYSIEKKYATIYLPFGRFTERLPFFIRNPIKHLLHYVSPGLFGGQLVYLCKH